MRYSASCNIRNAILAVYIGALVSAALGNSDESLKSINVLGRGLAASDDLTVSKYLEAADSDSSRSSVEMSQDPAEAAPVTNSRYAEGLFDKLLGDKASYGKGSKKSKFCDFLRHADSSMDKLLIGRVAESLGFANAFANVGSIFDSNCKSRNHPHPAPSRPVNPDQLKPDLCQAALVVNRDGTFQMPRGCQDSQNYRYNSEDDDGSRED